MKAKRVFIIVADSLGMGAAPDAAAFSDGDVNTLRQLFFSPALNIPTLHGLGLCNIEGAQYSSPAEKPAGAYARLTPRAAGKDTITGHWELAGVINDRAFPTYPNGFPEELIEEYSRITGRGVLCNKPYSGTQVIYDYGREQEKTGALIVYTSADSVFQVAAHEKHIGLEELYRCCNAARSLMQGEHRVARVIARPYIGSWPEYERTSNRRDYSVASPGKTLPDAVCDSGAQCIGVGKIGDIFAGRGLTASFHTTGNDDGMARTLELCCGGCTGGLVFTNLVDFDMLYGHRRDREGYAAALSRFDAQLSLLISRLRRDDLLMITADHGCDPTAPGTDHTREYVPLLLCSGAGDVRGDMGTRQSFADVAATAAAALGLDYTGAGKALPI